jgi:hypothetical protein
MSFEASPPLPDEVKKVVLEEARRMGVWMGV